VNPSPVRAWTEHEGRVLRLQLDRAPGNIVDAELVTTFANAFALHVHQPRLSAVVIGAEGPNFSYGASVAEHLPDQCAQMLGRFHGLLKSMLSAPVFLVAAVQGQCLGGGLELALASTRIIAAPGARFGQPEVKLGVFAPAASCLLPERVGSAPAADLLCSGRSVDAAEALRLGLADAVAEDPILAALEYVERHLLRHSAVALRYAMEAARGEYARAIGGRLDAVERAYLGGLMQTHDAVEGLEAFLAKRPPQWAHR
jgi:cyclohexa-1,5-dienecarbonyl-CoA hydratase